MNLCSDGHTEVCWDGIRDCPVCDALNENVSLTDKLDEAGETIDNLKSAVSDLKTELQQSQ